LQKSIMADTENAAVAASNPAEVSKTESSDVKPTTSTGIAGDAKDGESKAKSEDAGEEKWELNGKNKDRDERRGGRNDRNDRNDRFQDRRGGGRGRGRGRGGFNNNRKYVAHVLNLTNITDSFRQAQRGI
jgi:lupus La protein